MNNEDDVAQTQAPANRRWLPDIGGFARASSGNGTAAGNVWGIGGQQDSGAPRTPRRMDSLPMQTKPAGIFGHFQQFFDNVVNTVGCAPEMTWSHRAPLEDGSQLDEDEEGDDTVIQVATGSDGEPGDDAPAENEEDKEPASLRPRSTTSKLPCTANDEYEKMKSRMWGRTRDARFVRARAAWKNQFEEERLLAELASQKGKISGIMIYLCMITIFCAAGFIFYIVSALLYFPLPSFE